MEFENLNKYKANFKNYTELRVQENRNKRINLINGDVTGNATTSKSGVSARVYKDGNWGFSSSPDITEESISSVVNASTENVDFMNKKDDTRCGFYLPETQANYKSDYTTKKNIQNQKYWVDFVREIDGYLEKKYPELLSRNIIISGLDMEKSLFTSDGSDAYSMTPRALMYLMLSIDKDGEPISIGNPWGGLGQLEDKFYEPSDYFLEIDTLVEKLKQKATGIHADAGIKDVILDADLAGILAHEAIGHTTEADLVMGGSIAGNCMNQKVASDLITLIDYANTCNGEICPVPVYIDDEGTKSEDVVIIKDGILKKYMHNKDSARHFNTNPTGNARAYEFSDEPLIRMRNTAFVPGKSSLKEMISSIKQALENTPPELSADLVDMGLTLTGGGRVYTWYDQMEKKFYIEWSDVETYQNGSDETFQAVLLDPSYYATPTGDGEILIQYKEFNNTSYGSYDWDQIHGDYCTVGIEDHTMTKGLQYTFNNTYHPAAMQLADERSILITTRGSDLRMEGDLNYDQIVDVYDLMLMVDYNLGHEGQVNPYFGDINGDGMVNVMDLIALISMIMGYGL